MNLFSSLNDALFLVSLLFNFLLLFLALYFKEERLFFLALLILCFKLGFAFASIYSVKLFSSLFLPFFFCLFVFIKEQGQIFCRVNILKVVLLLFIILLSIILEQNTNFNAIMSKKILSLKLIHPISDLSFILFLIASLFLLLATFKDMNFTFLIALFLLFLPFFSLKATAEFASIWLFIYLLFRQYKFAFYDKNTKLANKKALFRFAKGSDFAFIALFKLDMSKNDLDHKEKEALVEIIIAFLERVLEKNKLFLYKTDIYASLFKNGKMAKNDLEMIRAFIEKHSFRLGSKDYKTTMSIAFVYIKNDFEQSLEVARKALIKAGNEGGNKIISRI